MQRCLPFALLLLSFRFASAQADDAKVKALVARAKAALAAEASLRKSVHCDGMTGNIALNFCLGEEAKKSDANYAVLAKAIGTLLRLPGDPREAEPQGRLPFDDAEDAWKLYRRKSCSEVLRTWGSGTGAAAGEATCWMDLTGSHMLELRKTYEDLFQ